MSFKNGQHGFGFEMFQVVFWLIEIKVEKVRLLLRETVVYAVN